MSPAEVISKYPAYKSKSVIIAPAIASMIEYIVFTVLSGWPVLKVPRAVWHTAEFISVPHGRLFVAPGGGGVPT